MCQSYVVAIQGKQGKKWKTVKSLDFPNETYPLCGCWLWDLDFEGEGWQKAKEAHKASGNEAQFEQTKADAILLHEKVRDLLFGVLKEITYEQRVVIERLI